MGSCGVDDGEDELRRSIGRDRMARGILAAMTAEKMARTRLFEEGIGERLRLRERLLNDRARYLEEIARIRAETEQIKADRDVAAAAAGVRSRGGTGGRGGGRRPRRRDGGKGCNGGGLPPAR